MVTNTGGESTDGEPVTVVDVLPEGVTLDHTGAEGFELRNGKDGRVDAEGTRMSCVGASCTFSGVVGTEGMLLVKIPLDVEFSSEQAVTNVVHVSGGGALDAFLSIPTLISSEKAPFGIAPGSATVSLSDTQAGAHADLTSTIGFNTVDGEGGVAGDQKETSVEFPPGFGGDLVDQPTCPISMFSNEECAIGTQVGVATVFFPGGLGREVDTEPVYDLAVEPGDVAKLGFAIKTVHVQADVTVLPGTYKLKTTFHNIEALDSQDLVSVTIWGVPSAATHDRWRWNPSAGSNAGGEFNVPSTDALVPFLASPTSCTDEPSQATFASVSWQVPQARPAYAYPLLAPLSDCGALGLLSTFTAVPTTTSAYAATGLSVELGVHQTNENPEALAASALKKAVVTLPEGMTLNPSAGAGLGACTRAEYEAEELQESPSRGCPIESKLGTVHIKTPALNEEGAGSVYLATPYSNPYSEPGHPEGSLLALYVIARFPARGVVVKVAGKVSADPITGRLVTTFEGVPSLDGEPSLEGLPPVPFSLFTFQFRQGETSPLVTPPACGSYDVTDALTPWSEPAQTLLDTSPAFEISSSFNGGPCPSGGVPPFAPELVAGTASPSAGSYSPLYLRVTRNDGEQEITGFASQLPPGLVANLTGIPFCSEADIAIAKMVTGAEEEANPSCPAASEIGHTIAEAGVGSVLAQAPGKLYMAGPFEGAPFSVVAITSAKVGPFDLGTVVVHLPLQLNSETAAVTILSGQTNQIPHIIKGIVIHVRAIRVYIERPNFTLNPTNCDPMTLTATVIGGGADPADPADNDPVTVTDPFHVADCANLAFKPSFKVSTTGKTSKADGSSLTAKLTYPKAPQGTQANIAKVKVELPKRLPSRLSTLQKACTERTFDTNPADCPEGSVVGTATAITPIVPVPLSGPAYFVSYGGARFPELVIVLQGYGITLYLRGETFINKKGITSTTFATVPDAPVGSFELKLAQGPHSALAANGNLCNGKLTMPTVFVAQNGATIHQTTKIIVTSCPKIKRTNAKKKDRRGRTKRSKGG